MKVLLKIGLRGLGKKIGDVVKVDESCASCVQYYEKLIKQGKAELYEERNISKKDNGKKV